jgi:hypothetical protein
LWAIVKTYIKFNWWKAKWIKLSLVNDGKFKEIKIKFIRNIKIFKRKSEIILIINFKKVINNEEKSNKYKIRIK